MNASSLPPKSFLGKKPRPRPRTRKNPRPRPRMCDWKFGSNFPKTFRPRPRFCFWVIFGNSLRLIFVAFCYTKSRRVLLANYNKTKITFFHAIFGNRRNFLPEIPEIFLFRGFELFDRQDLIQNKKICILWSEMDWWKLQKVHQKNVSFLGVPLYKI